MSSKKSGNILGYIERLFFNSKGQLTWAWNHGRWVYGEIKSLHRIHIQNPVKFGYKLLYVFFVGIYEIFVVQIVLFWALLKSIPT
jgi:hypothetical protein